MTEILSGVRVLDFGRYIAAPFCSQLLADMGAEVIRVDRPGGEADRERAPVDGSGGSLYFTCLNRNKRAITLSLQSAKGQELLHRLVRQSDVLVHNVSDQRAVRLGLDYQSLSRVNPRLVHLGISGFGREGPYSERVAFDGVVQAMSGAMSMTGYDHTGPTLSHIPWVDFSTGLYGASAVTAALFHRERTGLGQEIDLALYGTAVSLVAGYAAVAECETNGVVRKAVGNDWIYGVGGRFRTRDGNIVINVFSNLMWERLCSAIERADLIGDARLGDDVQRFEHRDLINEAIQAWASRRTSQEAVDALADRGVAAGPVQSVDEMTADPGVDALQALTAVQQPGIGSVTVAASPVKFARQTATIERAAPGVGEHNAEIYTSIGVNSTVLQSLAADGVI